MVRKPKRVYEICEEWKQLIAAGKKNGNMWEKVLEEMYSIIEVLEQVKSVPLHLVDTIVPIAFWWSEL